MALYTNIATELKPYCTGVTLGISIDTIAPSRDYVERKYIKKALGAAQLEAIAAAYEDSIAPTPTAMSSAEQALWEAIMAALAPLSVWHFAGVNATEITDKGQSERATEDTTPIRLWVSNLQRNTLYEQGMTDLDNLLAFLDENKSDYPDWVAGTGYTGLKNNLVQTTANFDEYVHINGSRSFFQRMKPSIKKVEYITIRKAISEEFYNRLIEGLQQDDLTATEQAVINKLIPAVAHMAFADCDLPIERGDDGVFMLSNTAGNDTQNKNLPSESVLQAIKRDHYNTGKIYLNEALDYLNKTATASILPEYYESAQYEDPTATGYGDVGYNNDDLKTIFSL
jgi:hypothetical protein